jgi:hypothetical protein
MLDSNFAHFIYNDINDAGLGYRLTEHENALVVDEIAEAGLAIVADHGDGLWECKEADGRPVLVGGDGSRRNAWAVYGPKEVA